MNMNIHESCQNQIPLHPLQNIQPMHLFLPISIPIPIPLIIPQNAQKLLCALNIPNAEILLQPTQRPHDNLPLRCFTTLTPRDEEREGKR